MPQPSVAIQVRRIVPFPVQLVTPRASTKPILVTPLQESVAVAEPVLLVVGGIVHSSVMSGGQVIAGPTLSLKLIVCRQVELLPQPSVAVQVRSIIGFPVQLFEPKTSLKIMFLTPLQESVAVAAPVLLVVAVTEHSKVRSAGQVITGGVVSWKVIL